MPRSTYRPRTPGIAGQLIGSGLARWLPFYASESLDQASPTSAGGLLPRGLLTQWGGGLVLLGYAAMFAAAALLITLKRDPGPAPHPAWRRSWPRPRCAAWSPGHADPGPGTARSTAPCYLNATALKNV